MFKLKEISTLPIFILFAIAVSIWSVNIAIVEKKEKTVYENYDIVSSSQFGLDIGIEVPVLVPKGRLPIGDEFGEMSFNIRSGLSGYSYQNTYTFKILNSANAQNVGTGVGTNNVEITTFDGGTEVASKEQFQNAISSYANQVKSLIGAFGNRNRGSLSSILQSPQNLVLRPFGGIAVGFPCCNGWFYRLTDCGKCALAGVGTQDGRKKQKHMAWWPSLRKWYSPTGRHPVLGLYIPMKSDCFFFAPPFCFCDCRIRADVTDYVVGTANNASKAAQTISPGF